MPSSKNQPRLAQKRTHRRAQAPTPPVAATSLVEFQQLIERIPAITYMAALTRRGRTFYYLSPQLQNLLGYAPTEWQSNPNFPLQCVCEPDRPAVLAALQHSQQTGQSFDVEYRCWARDQRLVWVRDEAVVTQREAGQPVIVQGILRDVTERRLAQENVLHSEARFRALAESATEGILIHRNGVVLEANHAAAVMFGYQLDAAIGLNLLELTLPETRETVQKMMALKFEGVYEVTGLRRDGSHVALEVSGRDVLYQGEPARVAIIRDRSDYMRNTLAINRQADEFAVLYELTNELATQHDLQAILDTVVGRITSLLQAGGGSIFLLDPAKGELVLEAVRGKTDLRGARLRLGEGVAGIAAQTRLPLAIPDYANWPRRSQHGLADGVTSVLQVPMLYGGELIGAIGVVEFAGLPREYTEGEIRLLTLVAGQAAAAVHNARLLESTRRRLAELEALNRISSAMRTAQTLDEMLPRLLEETLAVIETDTGLISLIDHEQAEFYTMVAQGWMQNSASKRLPLTTGIGGHVYATQQPYLISEFATDGYAAKPVKAQLPLGWGGGCFPIQAGELMVGFLFVGVRHPRQLQPPDVHLLNALTEIAGNAIQRMRLYAQTELRSQRLAVLHAIDLAITGDENLATTLNLVLEQITTRLNIDAASILLLDATRQALTFGAAKGFRTDVLEKVVVPVGESRAGQAVLQRQILYTTDLANEDSDFAWLVRTMSEGFVTQYAVPLISKGQVKGVLEVFNRTSHQPDDDWANFLEALATQAAIAIDNAELFEGLQRSNHELTRAYEQTLEGWSRALDLRDRETEGHTQRVTEITLQLARQLGLNDEELLHLRRGALLHDIGKMGIPDQILLKPGPLTDEEWKIMRLHPGYAYQMLAPINYLHRALEIPYCHHEKWDGTGYPRGLKADEIPLAARIFAVVDVWDALRSDRPYRAGWPEDRIFAYLREQSGRHFDPAVVEAFLKLYAPAA